ncbi:MAG TPA: radical SAM protein, partial [Chitinivibrionales bacterium]
MKTASYYTPLDSTKLRCDLCPHHCILAEGKRGICLTRRNENGVLVSLNYCRPVSTAVDPIEKKPLYHFFPGSRIFSTGPNGCTFKCLFCQNCEISQDIIPTREIPAASLAEAIIRSGTIGVAYTYSEPYIWFETIMDTAPLVKNAGLKNVMVTNGFMEPAPLAKLLSVIDAMNIDIKSIRPDFYKKLCKATLEPVLRTCETVKKKCHLEITNLIIPQENDT